MAPSLKRKRAPVSYREPSTSDGSSDDPSGSEQETSSHTLRRSSRAAARSNNGRLKRVVSYKESSSEDELDQEDAVEEAPKKAVPNTAIRTRSQRRQQTSELPKRTRQKPSPSTHARHRPPRNQRNSKGIPKKSETARDVHIPSDGVKPDWSTLPYQVLLQIFVYASHPVETSRASWLLNTACMCRAFVEPALTALYRSPPITDMDKTRRGKLFDGLFDPPHDRAYNYNNKIKSLLLDVTRMTSFVSPQRGLFDLGDLIKTMPQLTEVDLFDPADDPPYRRNRLNLRWHYPDGLFSAMKTADIRLKSWRWNRLLFFKEDPILWMREIHETSPFKGLVDITLNNFDKDEAPQEDASGVSLAEALATALSVIPNLRGITFGSCSVLTGELLALLPPNLHRLHAFNCNSLESNALQAFLISHGGNMKEMILNHNQSLDLSFLPILRAACPQLEILQMDLNYYNTFSTHHDSDPKYEDLLKPEEVPTWPPALRILNLEYLRKWTSEAAEVLFQSLIDSARELPYLRELVLKAILDISWRDRAQFRDRWIGKLRKTFMRKWTSPSPHLVSIRAYREWKQMTGLPKDNNPGVTPLEGHVGPLGADELDSDGNGHEPSDMTKNSENGGGHDDQSKGWRGRRLRPRTLRNSYGSGTTDKSSDEELSELQTSYLEDIKFVQGLCRVVDVSIDNLRPREELFGEDDFLDDEASGDEDWDEDVDDIEVGETRHAW